MKIYNLTPHEVSVFGDDGAISCVIPASGVIARLSTRTVVCGNIDGIPITTTEFGEIENLPEPQEGIVYIVSSLIAQRCAGRNDVFIPNESVRDSNGRIVGCKSLGVIR